MTGLEGDPVDILGLKPDERRSVMTNDPLLSARVRQLLETAPRDSLPMTYQQVAEALGLQPPQTIQRLAQALETLMGEDAEHGRPFIAALVVSRRGAGLPAQGFFDLAVELGRIPADPAKHAEAWWEEFERVLITDKPGSSE